MRKTTTTFALAAGACLAAIALPRAARADGTPECNESTGGAQNTECGTDAYVVSGSRGTAVGDSAAVSANGSTAVGANTHAHLGQFSSGVSEFLIGRTDYPGATAIGGASVSVGAGTLALGARATAALETPIFLQGSVFDPIEGASAVGAVSVATADYATALGYSSVAVATNAVAIGAYSRANQANTVSFGSVGNERKLTNIATGDVSATSTDGVNGSQLYATNQVVAGNTSAIGDNADAIAANSTAIAANGDAIADNSARITRNASAIAGHSVQIQSNAAAAAAAMNAATQNRDLIESNAAAIADHETRVAFLEDQSKLMQGRIDANSKDIQQLREGVAMALALDSPALPAGTHFGISGGVGTFGGKTSIAMAVTAAVSETTSLSAGFGLGTDSGEFGGRAGFQVAW